MYLLKCINDKSLHIVTNDNVFCDHEKIKENDRVSYQYDEKTMDGIVIMMSGDIKALEHKMTKILEIELEEEKNGKENVSEKRQRKPKNFSSFVTDFGPSKQSKATISNAGTSSKKVMKTKSNDERKQKLKRQKLVDETTTDYNCSIDEACNSTGLTTKKCSHDRQKDLKLLQEIQNKVFSNIYLPVAAGNCASKDPQISEDPEDLADSENPKDLEITDVHSTKSSSNSPVELNENHSEADDISDGDTEKYSDANSENDNQINNNDNNDIIELDDADVLLELRFPHQLLGKDCPKKMICLSKDRDIYCVADHYLKTVAAAKGVTSVARRLMDGVFNSSMILNCTLTGQPPRAQGKERQEKEYDCLDPVAVEVIIEHAMKRGKLKNWTIPERHQLMKSLSNKLRNIQKKMLPSES